MACNTSLTATLQVLAALQMLKNHFLCCWTGVIKTLLGKTVIRGDNLEARSS